MCCCDTNGWIRVIGCAQIILHTTTLVLIFAEALNETLVETNTESAMTESATEPLQYMDFLLKYILPVLTNVIGVAMGVFLFIQRGIKSDVNRQAVYLKYCGTYTIVLLTWYLLARYNLPLTKPAMDFLDESSNYEDAVKK